MCEKYMMLWVFTNASKRSPDIIICFILTTLKNEKHLCRHMRFDEDGVFSNSTCVTNLLADEFIISTENTGGDD